MELIPAYALGILEDREAGIVAEHLASCGVCRSELQAYAETAASLVLAGPMVDPSPAVKERLMKRVRSGGRRPLVAGPAPLPWWQRLAQSLQPVLRWQLVAVVLILALVISNAILWQRLNRSTDVLDRAIVLTGSEAAPQARGEIVVSGNGRDATLIVEGLAPLSGGVFSVNANGYSSLSVSAPQPFHDYSAFGVTVEPAGGSPQPTGQRVLGHNL
jgi:anti-sigma-K factor RskA